MSEDPDPERVQEQARKRSSERSAHVENILEQTESVLREHKYPTTSEELATAYADEPIDLPNETETLGSVFDRLVDERFESAEEAREAMYAEITGQAGTDAEFNSERELEELDAESQDPLSDSGGSGM